MASTKGPIRPTATTSGIGARSGRAAPLRHPTKQAALLLVAVTVLIVLLAVFSSLGQL
ncbi:MAG: hypothetical protein ACXWCM_18505 [Acidimicrobiales bacterium]